MTHYLRTPVLANKSPISLLPVIASAFSSVMLYDEYILTFFCYCTANETKFILIVTSIYVCN